MAAPDNIKMGMFNPSAVFKRPFRFLFTINNIVGLPAQDSLYVKPPLKTQRPSLSFKELPFEHLSETIYMPGKAEWKPIPLTVYDIAGYREGNTCKNIRNSVYDWIMTFYRPYAGEYGFAAEGANQPLGIKRPAYLSMYDGGGKMQEQWFFENAWCQDVSFNDVDMAGTEVMLIDLTLRYDRAYLLNPDGTILI